MKKRIQSGLAVLAMLILIINVAGFVIFGAEAGQITINIIHTNDMHGNLMGSGSGIGIDKVSALKQTTENAVLVDGGDATQGVALATLTKGADVIGLMNMAGYDVMACGNHEFDYGTENLLENAKNADFPILSANTFYEGNPLLAGTYQKGEKQSNGANIMLEVAGVKLGFFGLTTTQTATATNPEGIAGVTFLDETETAKQQVEELKGRGADVIIAITHMGTGKDVPCNSLQLAEQLKGSGLNAVIDGHSHSVVSTNQGGVEIGQTGTALSNVGMMTVTVDSQKAVSAKEKILTYQDMEQVVPDPAVTKRLEEINESQKQLLEERVADTDTTLWGGTVQGISEARASETNLGNLISDSMIYKAKQIRSEEFRDYPVVAIENGGGIRATIGRGEITQGDVINVLPFSNTVMLKEITPKLLYEILELSVSSISGQNMENGMLDCAFSGGFLQVGGLRFSYDPTAETGKKVKSVYVSDLQKQVEREDQQTKLLLASNDFVIAGGNDYTMLTDLKTLGEGGGLDEILKDYIGSLTQNGKQPLKVPLTEGRITVQSAYDKVGYTANIYLKNQKGALLSDMAVDCYVDGNKQRVVSDKEGLLRLGVSDGPHTVSLSAEGEEIYINNYSGAGIIEIQGDYPVSYPSLLLDEQQEKQELEERFQPDQNLKRYEAVVLAVDFGGKLEKGRTYEVSFEDVDEAAWYRQHVGCAQQNGYVMGEDDGMFHPENLVSRAQFAAIVCRTLGFQGAEETRFSDCEGHWANREINALAEKGLLEGYEDGTFRPEQPVTFAEAVKILYLATDNFPYQELPVPEGNEGHWIFTLIPEMAG